MLAGWRWLVDPQDGTSEFLKGRRGSSISVGLLHDNVPVLAVVHSPNAPDRGRDTIAWAEGAGPIRRNDVPIEVDLSRRRLDPSEFVWATASAEFRPETWARAVAPARYIAMPSIAYRLARVAAGDGIATASIHGVNEYDIAAGMALVRAAGGVVLDAAGNEIVLSGAPNARASGCFAGEAGAARRLAEFDWHSLENEPRREPRVIVGYPRVADEPRVARAHGCMLGQFAGDSLGSLNTIAGQPTDDSEMALALARSIVANRRYVASAALAAYRDWTQSGPFDFGSTTRRGMLGEPNRESQSNGSLMRVSPIGIWAAGDPSRAAASAREDSALTHPHRNCVESCAAYAAAIATGVAGGTRDEMLQASLAEAKESAVVDAIRQGAGGNAPADFTHPGWVLLALQNAFYQLFAARNAEEGIAATAGSGGDTDTKAAIAGALLGAAHGRDSIPSRWILPILACRSLRPSVYWPDDALDLAEALLQPYTPIS